MTEEHNINEVENVEEVEEYVTLEEVMNNNESIEEEEEEEEEDEEEEDARTPAVINLERELLTTVWVKEAQLIQDYVPEEDLTKAQIRLLEKCINKEEFTDKQFNDLKILLTKYRALLKKLNPEEKLQSLDDTIKLIESEQAFLDLMDEEQEKYLTVHLPIKDKVFEFEFEVLPIVDSRVIESIELQVDLFRDFSLEETATYATASQKDPNERTDSEQRIIDKMNQMLSEKLGRQKLKSVDNFLANQLKIKGSNADLEKRKEFWKKFPFNAKFTVFMAVQRRLGLTEVDNQTLFPFGE